MRTARTLLRSTVPAGRPAARPPLVRPLSPEDLRRVVIEQLNPEVDGGRFPVKRCVGEEVLVRATIHADSADVLWAVLQHRFAQDPGWSEVPMTRTNPGLDLWEARFLVDDLGRYEYQIQAGPDRFATWRQGLAKKAQAGQDVSLELLEGAHLVQEAGRRAAGLDVDWLRRRSRMLAQSADMAGRIQAALDEELFLRMARYVDRNLASASRTLAVIGERERARTGAWYEMFPRSAGPDPSRSATLAEAAQRLPYVASMGFDVLYLPPIHPIGRQFRKGPNNHPKAKPTDPGSPWAIGSREGGHMSVDPALGTLEDFDAFVHAAGQHGLEVAMDLAFQCAPDHPYVREHPDWFRHRADGSIQHAENPPKKYEDIVPFDFECADFRALWQELLDVVLFWARRGIRIFRVDNPHTKPYRFWEWLIQEVRASHPDVVFLSEAFTRPAVMEYLAKCGFSQSYTYFTWRTGQAELAEYLAHLTRPPVSDFMRPNLFANTPDILHAYLQTGGRPAFQIRLLLAATLSASYGIYGPAFELGEARAFPGTEDYVNSEKYQVRVWDLDHPGSLRPFITRVNAIRRQHAALQGNRSLEFLPTTNDQIIAYAKRSPDGSEILLMAVNLDPHRLQAGFVELPVEGWALPTEYDVEDLLTQQTFHWRGAANFVQLDPAAMPAHILRIRHG